MLLGKPIKASEVTRRYALGERDFRHANLRGQSFQDEDLGGADFSYADIRGTRFCGANLQGSQFVSAQAGINNQWLIVLVIITWLILGLSSHFSLFLGGFIAGVFARYQTTKQECISYWLLMSILIAPFLLIAILEGQWGVIAITPCGAILGWLAAFGGETDNWVSNLVSIFLTFTGSTSFHHADLTEVDFSGSKLCFTDFREANLTRTCWKGVKKLKNIQPGRTYLKNIQVRQWLIGQGQTRNLDYQDLQGVNLQGANLADMSLIGADLREANLRNANLSRAKLVGTKLDQTDLRDVCLTGAYIDSWDITHQTELEGVECEYVYLKLPSQDEPNPYRQPQEGNRNFAPGEFIQWVTPRRKNISSVNP